MKKQWGVSSDPGVMNTQARRLVLFAPDAKPWNEIGERWENVSWLISQAGEGCSDSEFDTILKQIAKSV
jgi:hypothetical protein